VAAGVVCLLVILGLQLVLSVRRESQTWDEGDHIFAGYMSSEHADFGLNPEHPPMLKLLATAPLLSLPLKTPELQDRYFKEEAFLDGKDFLYRNDADLILFRTRMTAATLTLLLALLLFHAFSSVRAFPSYIAYSNELWGGTSNTYRYLSDSNADWGEQLKATKQYLDKRGVKDCWFVYFAEGVAEPGYYGIQCQPLPTINTLWLNQQIDVPAAIDGPVLISASNLSGFEFGPGPLNPYEQFKRLRPTADIAHGVFVFDGNFEMPLASALSHVQKAQNLLAAKQVEQALAEAQAAVALAPDAVQPQITLGEALSAMGQPEEARTAYEKALRLAKTIEPEFQARSIPDIEQKLADK
jgi:tetratricopeptide (TPR) repeat protein